MCNQAILIGRQSEMNENERYAFVLQNQIAGEGHMMLWQHFHQGSNDHRDY